MLHDGSDLGHHTCYVVRSVAYRGQTPKTAVHRKEPVNQRVSAAKLVSMGEVAAVMVAVLAFVGLIAQWSTQDSVPVAGAGQSLPPSKSAPIPQSPNETPNDPPPSVSAAPFPADDRGFIDSSARCQGTQSAFAIGRTNGSLVVICGEQTGRYEYLGVRLSDAAVCGRRPKPVQQLDFSRGSPGFCTRCPLPN